MTTHTSTTDRCPHCGVDLTLYEHLGDCKAVVIKQPEEPTFNSVHCPDCKVDLRVFEHITGCMLQRTYENPREVRKAINLLSALGSPKDAGIKHDQNKPQMDLLDAYAMEQLAAVLTFGANKYAPNNWRKGISSSRLLAASLRHIFAYLKGNDLDEESNLPHLAHAMCCLMFAINLAKTKPECSTHSQVSVSAKQTAGGGGSNHAAH